MRFPALGAIYAVPSGANPTPIPIAISKDVGIDFKITKKGLNGQWKWFIDVAEFRNEAAIKFKNADFRAAVAQMAFTGISSVTGQTLPATGEAWTIPTTPFQVTVSQSATWVEDGGVLDYTTGKWMTRAASATGTGIYSVAAGVYTFNTADAGHNISIVYSYTGTGGFTLALNNATMGPSTGYAVRIYNQYTINGAVKAYGFKFPNVHFEKLSVAMKSEDWAEQSLDGIVAQDPNSQNVLTHFVGD